ncbi:similar to Saccharomyces cerevisiae YPL012W RRP12 Protein required for export of the ribosomal subunits [Maudiozyma barnettii]|uniref:Similar to Saccharomyces cerevisiae YPL012W RRP12 Protein required for export of the ribosomal subunits n=1 Tax=Maudiozyma barnettii TaxID=61262 RepID=A0A8H2VF05_9SACH|nr:mRNA-binding protein RRP12 [Kazachstania barnettii]CAB4254389.1 similar to Saccharomyces cerevisiae YPL012W RRP12 Protein required for export of the ribosomal subunits [Kazachstania barnettii]CAD1782289.1 similar to Saccharomyces cerevisiae YPL012W RRP12 Protein required for export of the ribosomal subunits [Kazachstania barnettii]
MDADQVAHMLELEDKLSKIRHQATSKLENQKHIAIILTAVEENIEGHDTNDTSKNIISYMVAFMSLLDQSIDNDTHNIIDLQLTTAATYLLDIIFQYAPKKLLRSKFSELLAKIAPCITDEKAEPLLIRSAIGCLASLLVAQDAQAWNNTHNLTITPMRGLQGLLELSLDPRPKIRKRSLEALHKILENPPVAPTAEHVASTTISVFAINQLTDVLNELNGLSSKQLKNQTVKDDINSKVIKCLRLVSTVVTSGQWPTGQIEPLCDMLLDVTKSSDQYLVSTSFECFEKLFNSMAESTVSTGLAEDKYVKVIDTIFQLRPSNNDTHLVGSWIAVVVKGMSTYAVGSPMNALVKVPEVFELMSTYLQSENKEISFSASQCLIAVLTDAIKDEIILSPEQSQGSVSKKDFKTVTKIINSLSEMFSEFLTVRYTNCTKEILNILAAAYKKFRFRSHPALDKSLQIVDSWRVNEKKEAMELVSEIDLVIGNAISAIGPDVVLQILPLNLNNEIKDQPGRAWLLPLLRDYTRHAKLSIFISDLLPAAQVFESQLDSFPKESVQLRIYQTIIDQIWSTLPHFAELPVDLRESFTDKFASDLCSLLYSNTDLRTTICHALKMLVESNIMYSEGALQDDIILRAIFPVEESKKNLEYLTSKSVNILAVLFNIFTQTASNLRGYILDTIESYLKITTPEDVEKTFNNVCGLLKNSMEKEAAAKDGSNNNNNNKPQLTATLLDIIVIMVRYLPSNCYGPLFMIFDQTVNSDDTLIQKRAYRIISKLSELSLGEEAISNYLTEIEAILLRNSNSVHTSARSGRLAAIKTVVNLLPPDHMNFIVQVSAEIILATKDVNEKTRDLAFEILILMAERMQNGGSIDMGEGNVQVASLAEFFKIISAGLIGESQHMVSSTITAFACLMFEFKDSLAGDIVLDIYDTVELYLTSNSREIAKSAIGFAKVCILGLPEEMMRPKVPALIPKLLRWSHEHTGHFKAKVKHIIERLIRRFGYEYVEANFPEDDLKLLTNIRKSRNRSKRKDADGTNEETTLPTAKGPKFMSAFDEAVYASSDNEDEDDEDGTNHKKSKQYIIEKSGGNPLDLLDADTLAHISSTRPKKFNKKDHKKKLLSDEAFAFDDEGKLIVKGKKGGAADDDDPIKNMTSGINAYLEAVKTGPVRGQKNKLKFKKGKKEDDNFSDDESAPKRNVGRNKIGKNFKKGGKFKSRRRL